MDLSQAHPHSKNRRNKGCVCFHSVYGVRKPDIDPSVRRRMHDHLADLAMLGILNRQSRNEGRAGGQYYEYEFNAGLRLVCEVVDTFDGVLLPRHIYQQL